MNKLYYYINRAREATAGSNIQDKETLLKYAKEALQYAVFTGADITIQNKLIQVYELIINIKEYGDRLKPDNILCDILNEMLKNEM